MRKPEIASGKFQVTRWCCTSGMCFTCRAAGDMAKRKRVVHTCGVSKEWADYVAGNWNVNNYEPKVEGDPA